jgi:hypothetical protein
MVRSATCLRSLSRQLTSCVIAFALIIQSVLLGLSGSFLASADRSDDGLAGLEFCLHNADGSVPSSNDTPSGNPDSYSHCKYCALAGLQLFAALDPLLLPFAISDSSKLVWPAADWRDEISAEYPSQRPRGPPLAA